MGEHKKAVCLITGTLFFTALAFVIISMAVSMIYGEDGTRAVSSGTFRPGTFMVIMITQIRKFIALPLLTFSAVFAAGSAMIIRRSFRPSKPVKTALAIASAVVLIIAVYYSISFTLLTVFPPLPFAAGLFIMKHPCFVDLWWALGAALSLSLCFGAPAVS